MNLYKLMQQATIFVVDNILLSLVENRLESLFCRTDLNHSMPKSLWKLHNVVCKLACTG